MRSGDYRAFCRAVRSVVRRSPVARGGGARRAQYHAVARARSSASRLGALPTPACVVSIIKRDVAVGYKEFIQTSQIVPLSGGGDGGAMAVGAVDHQSATDAASPVAASSFVRHAAGKGSALWALGSAVLSDDVFDSNAASAVCSVYAGSDGANGMISANRDAWDKTQRESAPPPAQSRERRYRS